MRNMDCKTIEYATYELLRSVGKGYSDKFRIQKSGKKVKTSLSTFLTLQTPFQLTILLN